MSWRQLVDWDPNPAPATIIVWVAGLLLIAVAIWPRRRDR